MGFSGGLHETAQGYNYDQHTNLMQTFAIHRKPMIFNRKEKRAYVRGQRTNPTTSLTILSL
jgi:hypothetical protein